MTKQCELDEQYELGRFMDDGGIDPEVARQRRAVQSVLDKDDDKRDEKKSKDKKGDIDC